MRLTLPTLLLLASTLPLMACEPEPEGPDEEVGLVEGLLEPGAPALVFRWPEPLGPDSDLRPYHFQVEGIDLPAPEPIPVTEESWFYWIDDAPGAHFVHPNRFVLVSVATGEVTVSEQDWWPVLDGEGLWTREADYWNPANHAFSNVEPPQPAAGEPQDEARDEGGAAAGGGRRVALVVNGWEEGETHEETFEEDAEGMTDALERGDFDVTYLGPEQDDNPDRDGENTWQNRDEFWDANADLGAGDTLVVFVTSHGSSPDTDQDFEEGNGPRSYYGGVSETELREQLGSIDQEATIIVVVNGCESGGAGDGMDEAADITLTATSDTDSSYADLDETSSGVDDNPADEGSEYVSGVVTGLNEILDSEELQQQACEEAEASGEALWERFFAMAHLRAMELDLAAQSEWSYPRVYRGDPSVVKPQPPELPECEDVGPVGDDDDEPDDDDECDPPIDPDPLADLARALGDLLLDDDAPASILDELECDPQGEDTQHSDGVQEMPAVGAWDLRIKGLVTVELPDLDEDVWPAEYPCGGGPDGATTLCPTVSGAQPAGEWVIFMAGYDDTIPLVGIDYSTWAVVCDSDDSLSDNWEAWPAYPADFWQDTDLWFAIDQAPGDAPVLSVKDASSGSAQNVASGARAVISGSSMMLAVPRVEFAAEEVIDCRFTSFRHTGDWGIESGDWNGDVTPTVAEGLLPLELGPRPEPEFGDTVGEIPCDGQSFDLWLIDVPYSGVLDITVDTLAPDTVFDPYAMLVPGPDWQTTPVVAVGDDEFGCTYPPPAYGCPQFSYPVEPGPWYLAIFAYEANCNASGVGAYGIDLNLDGELLPGQLAEDDFLP